MLTDKDGNGYMQVRGVGHREISFSVDDPKGDLFFNLALATDCIYRLEARSLNRETGIARFVLIPDNGFIKVLMREQNEQ